MRPILYLKQILLTHPHLKKYYFPICAKGVELEGGLRDGGPILGWGGQDHGRGAAGPSSTV